MPPLRRRLAGLALTILLTSCGSGSSEQPPSESAASGQVNGAGATFPYPIYSKWFAEYSKVHPAARINYQSIGSGGGIRQLLNQTVFFGATDGPMTDDQMKAAGPILHLPTVLGAVVPIYNLPGVSGGIRFSGSVLADIMLGKITKWNDEALVRLNPGMPLPGTDITVVHRSDGSGTTFIFVDYLSKVSEPFKSTVGVSTSVMWPVGVGGKGNEGVAGLVSQTPGALGYVELIYALQNQLTAGAVQNVSGEFVVATPDSVTKAAAQAVAQMPADFRVSITNAEGAGAYPISSFTWILLYEAPQDLAKSRVMVDFMRWALTEGQAFATDLGYARLPDAVVQRELKALDRIKVQ